MSGATTHEQPGVGKAQDFTIGVIDKAVRSETQEIINEYKED